eukprot:CAMPEP_0172727128 /NCGR_PEP_ID=MMETSP1074-20121228/91505_1 /TAXON_ID=2916 /ORGANISM="Ceratium fusus, Strain PA161109" /LENGTH=51 /DNA_ID=CAMNT_0013554245 /DNA_START=73 /DNA_END=224 /DNA_ORIENTATION=-
MASPFSKFAAKAGRLRNMTARRPSARPKASGLHACDEISRRAPNAGWSTDS